MLQGYNESRLKSSFRKFYGGYNDLFCDYKLSLAHMLNDLFHTICSTGISILVMTIGNPVYLISTKYARWVWPVSRGYLLFHDTSSYLCICLMPVLPYTRFCNLIRVNLVHCFLTRRKKPRYTVSEGEVEGHG
jgi:hypothetical protein